MEQLFNRIQQLHLVLTAASVPYRMVGGRAVFIHVSERDPLRARLTADVDAEVITVACRLKGRVHIQDLDIVGLITPEIELHLSDFLQDRLAEIRASE